MIMSLLVILKTKQKENTNIRYILCVFTLVHISLTFLQSVQKCVYTALSISVNPSRGLRKDECQSPGNTSKTLSINLEIA